MLNQDRSVPTVAAAIAEYLRSQGIDRVYSLPGSHMKPIWEELRRRDVRIVSARHEVAAVHMAQAEADLRNDLAVTIVTTGPGLTNAVTGLASAYLSRSPVLVISTRPPTEQAGMGALEEIDQAGIVSPVCRRVEVVHSRRHVVDRLDRAVGTALGDDGPRGPVYVELATETLREEAAPTYTTYARRTRAHRPPEEDSVAAATELIGTSSRPLVISGREAIHSPEVLSAFVAQIGAVYLDTRASKGAASEAVETYVPAVRARAMAEADLVVTVGRELDFEVAYGSPAVFRDARHFVRIGRSAEETQANRRGDVELRADPAATMEALIQAGAEPTRPDLSWREEVVRANADKRAALAEKLRSHPASPATGDAGLHPYELIRAVNEQIEDDTIVIVDGGDVLSWSRSTLRAPTYLDLGPFGCLGVGVPFAVAASLNHPERPVVLVTGDGALGFNVMELETAVREGARFVVVVANNSAWNIERNDQVLNYDAVLGTELGQCSFDRLSESLGVTGYQAGTVEELADALDRACDSGLAVVDVRVGREPLSPDTRSGLALVPDYHVLTAWDEAEKAWLKRQGSTA